MDTDRDIPGSNLILKIKKEPKDEEEFCNVGTEEIDDSITKSLVLRFVKDKNGNYSVVPLIKPDPFFEENLDDSCHAENSFIQIKSEEQEDNVENVVTKEENKKFNKMHPSSETEGDENEITENDSSRVFCTICLYTNKERAVRRHMKRVHVNITKHSCLFCDKKNFKEKITLDSHILRNHRDIDGAVKLIKRRIFKCSFCKYETLNRHNFKRHLTTHGETRLKKRLAAKLDGNGLEAVKSKHEIKRALLTTKYDCFHCPYTTKDKGSIVKHLRLHRKQSRLPFSCKGCNRMFNEKNSLDSHIVKRHIDNVELLQSLTNRVNECDLCAYKDVNKNKLIRHKRSRHVKKENNRKKMRKRKVQLKVVKK